MEFLEQLFAALDHEESVAFLIFMIGAFLLGFLIAWLLWGGIANRRRRELQKAETERQAVQAEYEAFKEQYALKEADLQKANVEVEEFRRTMEEIQSEKNTLSVRLRQTQEALAQKDASLQTYLSTIEDLNDQIIGLKTKNTQLARDMEQIGTSEASMDKVAEMQSSFNSTIQRLLVVEERLAKIAEENQSLKQELQHLQQDKKQQAPLDGARPDTKNLAVDPVLDLSVDPALEPPVNEVEQARVIVREAIGNRIPLSSPEQKDDLKRIDGIGPFIERKLNELGLYTFAQIASLDDSLVDFVTTAIEFFPGRIERDNWVGQAAKLAGKGEPKKVAVPPVASIPPPPFEEDLKVIEGIGPKIEELLKNAGISTLTLLSQTNVEDLNEILRNAGDRFRLHDPSTWPQQAVFAATGQWEKLKEYQDYLIGGRDIK